MNGTNWRRGLPALGIVVLVAALLAGCSGFGPQATPLPTRTPLPTYTATPEQPVVQQPPVGDAPAQVEQPPVQSDQQAAAPTDTPAPEATPTPTTAPPQVVLNDVVNIRTGPGTAYNLLGTEQSGSTFRVIGKSPDGTWWQIDYEGKTGWVFGQLVTATNTEAVAVAQNIPPTPVPPPPTNTPVPQPTPTPGEPQPTAPPARQYEYNVALLQRCDPNAGVTYVNGTVYKGGQPINGQWVAFSTAADGPIVAKIISGPHQGYEGWRAGFYSHILQANGPREGTWYFWIVDGADNRISEIASVHTDGTAGDGKCQQAIIDFDSR
ncbi:MAG: SH3 domain-containing protein [Caldilineaceae bacterium]|nr:SH3 domain-containing protein [Caldilineaceae bacterium]